MKRAAVQSEQAKRPIPQSGIRAWWSRPFGLRCVLMVFSAQALLGQTIDRTKPPVSGPPRAYKLPSVFETKLPNGLTVVLAEDTRFPLVTLRLVFLAGNKRDPREIPGLAASLASMLMQGTK